MACCFPSIFDSLSPVGLASFARAFLSRSSAGDARGQPPPSPPARSISFSFGFGDRRKVGRYIVRFAFRFAGYSVLPVSPFHWGRSNNQESFTPRTRELSRRPRGTERAGASIRAIDHFHHLFPPFAVVSLFCAASCGFGLFVLGDSLLLVSNACQSWMK